MITNQCINIKSIIFIVIVFVPLMAVAHFQSAQLLVNLPQNCPTPDAFAIAPNGTLTLSCPNFASKELEGELFTINSSGKVTHLATVPRLGLKTKANPMGIAYDERGALYVADSRGIKQGRIIKLHFNHNKLSKVEVIASGINPNGLRYHQGAIYVTQLQMPKIKSEYNVSGIYRFDASARNLQMTNTLKDKELIFIEETHNPEVHFGLDGLAFDSKGNLFTADLGDGEIYKLKLNSTGNIIHQQLYAKVNNNARIDGMAFDQHNNLYLAGFGLNQIFKVDTNKKVSKIADYPDNNGSNGQIDQPADLIVYQGKLVISNFDLLTGKGIRNTKHDKPYTLSYINLN